MILGNCTPFFINDMSLGQFLMHDCHLLMMRAGGFRDGIVCGQYECLISSMCFLGW
jgi:hypothetical protein